MFSQDPNKEAAKSAPSSSSGKSSSAGSGMTTPTAFRAVDSNCNPTPSMLFSAPSSSHATAPVALQREVPLVTRDEVVLACSSSGRTTPVNSGSGRTTPVNAMKKPMGRERGAFAYGAEEHLTLLAFIKLVPNSFNSSETSPEWQEVHKKMVDVYNNMGVAPRQSTTLHSHFIKLYKCTEAGD
jgi:hypothetical protein